MNKIGRILGIIGIVVLVLALAGGLLGVYTVRRSFPQDNGHFKAAGLQGTVEIYRDKFGIPQIYAGNSHDLFFAQGYVHAQDRFWQMDFWRHITSGRLSEFFGEGQLETDMFLRTVGWRRIAEEEYKLATDEEKLALDSYAEGVNAYISSRSALDLSLEYSILGLIGVPNYRPEPWTPADSLAWAKSMAWDLGGNLDEEIKRAILLQAIGPEMTADFMPLYPADHPVIIPNPATASVDYSRALVRLNALTALLGSGFEGIGSNDWVIAGSRTTTGQPLLADDPHLSIQMPAIWYEIGLHCTPKGPACPYDVTGFSLAGDPGVIIGHTDRIAWGVTNVGPDVQDLFIEKLNPANPNQYEVNGQWVDMDVRTETLQVRGGDPVELTVRSTRHGPLIDAVYGDAHTLISDTVPVNGVALDTSYGLALRWTALEPTLIFSSVLQLNRAQNWNDFRRALQDWAVPSQNFVYADVDGNIGYQTPGNIPLRQSGDGLLPVPGWTDEYEWTGYIPFDEMPYSYHPPPGSLATANNAVVGPDYPYLISLDWDPGYRAQRIVDLIEAQDKISPEYIAQIHGDDLNLGAQEVLPHLFTALANFEFGSPGQALALDALHTWDMQMRLDSQPAAVYASFFTALVNDTFRDQVPEDYWPSGGASTWVTLRALLTNPNSVWWDDTLTTAVETRDDILQRAFVEGYAALQERLGSNPDRWTWGALHTSTFRNQTLGKSGVAPIEALFNRGPFATAGGASIVNATSFNITKTDPYAVTSIPSMRMIVDLSDLANSRTIFSTGESGHAYHPNYIDMADLWRTIQYHPMLWNRSDVEGQAAAHLTLTP